MNVRLSRTTLCWVSTLALSLSAAGCGDDDGGGGGSGVDQNKLISELTNAEAAALCTQYEDDFDANVGDARALACTVEGIFAGILGGSVEACTTYRDECIAGDGPEDSLDECGIRTAAERDGCDVTVGQLEACADAQFDVLAALVDDVSCDLVEDPDSIPEPAEPAECAALAEDCPVLFGDE